MEFNENQDIAKNQIDALLGREDMSPIDITLNSIRNQAKQPTGLIDTSYKTEDNSLFAQSIQESGKPSLTQRDYNVDDAFALVGGEYIKKFDTYERGVDNMERHAQRQSTMDKWINGTAKALGKTAGAIAGGTVGIGYGVASAISNQNRDNLYDNDFSNWLNDLDQKMNYKLPNYYTKQEQEKGLFGQMGTANFWSDKVLGGLSFTAGAIVSEGIWAYATGGASLASVGARWGTKALALTKVGGSIGKFSNILKKALPTKMLAGVTSKTAAIRGGQIGEVINTARFTMTSAGYESSVEALHFKKEAEENFYNNFESLNGRPPNQEDIATFEENLSSSANAVFASNMAIVGSSNLMAFGKIFKIKSPIKTGMSDFLDKKIYGLGLNNASKVLTPTRLQSINRGVLPYVRSMVEEGLYEEGMQSVTSSSANKWVEHTYNPETQLEGFDMAGAVYDSMAHQYGTKEGWVENGVGMIIGIIGEAGMRGRSADVTSKEAKFKQEETFAQTYTQKALGEHMLMLTRIKGFSQEAEKASQSGNLTAEKIATDGVMNSLFNHGHQIGRDINDTVEHMSSSLDTMTADQFKEMGIEESQIDAYKEETLTAFKETAQQFTQNRKYAEYMIGRNQLKGLGDIKGNLLEGVSVEVSNELLIQALTYTLTAGESSGKIMDDIISTIGTEVGEGYEASLKVARKLGGQKGATVKEVNKTVKQIQVFEQERKALMQELIALQNAPKELEPNRQEGGRLREVNVRLSELNTTIEGLNNTLSTLTEKINSNKEFRKDTKEVEVGTLMNSENEISTDDLLALESNIKKLEALIENYRGVNPQKAAYLEELLKEFENANGLFRANQRTAIALSSGELKLGNINSWVQKKLEKSGSLDQFTNEWLTDLLTNYTSRVVKSMSQSIEDTESISDKAYQDFLDSKKEEVPSEIINSLVVKVVNEEPLSDREKEMYEAKKEEVEDLVKQTVKPVNKEKEALEKLNKEEKEALDKLEKEISEDIQSTQQSGEVTTKQQPTTRDYNKEVQKIKEEFQKKREKVTGVQNPKTKKEVVRDRLEELIKTKFYNITSIINPDGSIAVVKPTEAEIEEYRELLTQPTDGLFAQNQKRLEELKQKLGQWRLLDSAIGDDNTSLAELIEQLSQLEQEVEQEETLLEITPEDSTLLNDDIETTAKQDVYELAQNTLAAVTVRATDTHYNFSHLSPLDLIRRVGGDVEMNTGKVVITNPTIEQIKDSEAGTVFTVDGFTFRKKDKAGTIEVKKEDFNSNSQRINMLITNTGAVKWSYKDVYEFNGAEFVKVNSSYEENIEPQEIYNLKPTDKVTFEVAEEDTHTQELLDKYNRATKKEKKDQAFQELIAGVKIYVVNKDGVKVSTLKALRGSTQDDTMLEIRKAATDAILQGVSKVPMEVEVSNIFMGSPRFEIDNNGNIQNIEFTDKATTTVLATGYVQNGELTLNKDFTDEVNKTYIGQISKKNNSKKIPVVVIQKGAYKVAYPVSVKKTKAEKGHLVEAVLQQSLTKPQIAIEINKLIQEHKIETSKVIAEDITDAKIEEIIEAFNNKEVFRTAEEFADKSYNTNSLKADALINIDLENIDQAISDVKVRLNFGTLTYKGNFEELENSMIGFRNTLSDLTIEVELDIMNYKKHGRYSDSKGNLRENAFTNTLTAAKAVHRKPKDDNEIGANINILRDAISKITPTDKKSLGEVKLKEILQAFKKLDRAKKSMKVQKEIIKNGQNKVNNSCK